MTPIVTINLPAESAKLLLDLLQSHQLNISVGQLANFAEQKLTSPHLELFYMVLSAYQTAMNPPVIPESKAD